MAANIPWLNRDSFRVTRLWLWPESGPIREGGQKRKTARPMI